MCGHTEESIKHIFFECPYTMNALFEANRQCVLPAVNAENCPNEFVAWVDGKSMDELQSIIMVWQEVWNARNTCWLEKKVPSSIQAGRNAVQPMSSFAEEKELIGILSILNRRNMRWQLPPEDVCKVNADTALSTKLELYWNWGSLQGRIIGSKGRSCLCMGCRFQEHNSRRGCSHVYNCIEGTHDDLSNNGSILKDFVLCASWFRSFICGYIFRECNEGADFLAKGIN